MRGPLKMGRDGARGYRDDDTVCVRTYGDYGEMKRGVSRMGRKGWRVASTTGKFNRWKVYSMKDTVTVTFERGSRERGLQVGVPRLRDRNGNSASLCPRCGAHRPSSQGR